MTLTESKAAWLGYRHVCVCAAVIVLLGGCSTMESMPQSTAPASEKGAQAQRAPADGKPTNASGSKDQAKPSNRYQALQGGGSEQYPSLSAVPARPKEPTSARLRSERASLHEGLLSDAANARYSDQELRARDLPIIGKSPAGMALKPDVARSNERITEGTNAKVEGEALRVAGGDPSQLPPPKKTKPAPPKRTDVNEARYADPPAVTQTIQVATIYFADGSARLSGDDKKIVKQVAEIVQSRRGRVQIIGHSSMGRPGKNESQRQRANYQVSLKRAQAIAAALRRYGISPSDMAVSGEGSRKPIYAETAPSGAASNRRAEIYMEYQKRI